ncbi:class I SAM-dependent methyltransferase [Burkholderia territorii]|uniref:class I SAM-dependent methyltransferase n=1 Tax=Burkholderia territorii TaxID=1503055 RepID=UPI000A81144D|nr:class I SAM-dependent methyltransferase [Burkholderia territorii]
MDKREKDVADVFGQIFREGEWRSTESVSGWGSELNNTQQLIRELPGLLRRFDVQSMLDVPCGDFNWMRHVNLSGIEYIGADIVEELVSRNRAEFGRPGRRFLHLDLLKDPLPECDLILCRDCLFHFSHADVFLALDRFARSSARWLLTTTFVYQTWPRNADIVTGGWTPINLEMPPYSLDPPRVVLVEGSSESISYGGELGIVPMTDRCLGLWDMTSVRRRVLQRRASIREGLS